jgi:MFS family permease
MLQQIFNLFTGIVKQYRTAYSGLPREAWILSLVEVVNRSGTMVIFFLTLYLTETFGISPEKAGYVITSYGVGALFGAYLGGKFTDMIGAYSVQKVSLISTGIFYIILGYVTHYWFFLVLMFILGVVGEALHPANATAMSQVCPSELRTKGFALNRLATNFGVTIGPVLGGYLALINYRLLFWIDGITCVVAAGLFVFFFKSTSRPMQEAKPEANTNTMATPKRTVLKDYFFLKLLLLTFLMGLIFVQMFSTYPLYFKNFYGFPENTIGLLIAINTIMIVLFEMLLMEKLRGKNVISVISIGAFLLCAGFAIIPLGRGHLYAAFTVVVWTIGEMLALPFITTVIADHSDDAVRGQYMGLYSLSFALAFSVGPTLGTTIYGSIGPDYVWLFCGIIAVVVTIGFFSLKAENDSLQKQREAQMRPVKQEAM